MERRRTRHRRRDPHRRLDGSAATTAVLLLLGLASLATTTTALPPPPTLTGYYCDPAADGRACCPPEANPASRPAPLNCPLCTAAQPQPPSPLFGCRGELAALAARNAPASRLPHDWSYAGYGAGGADPPTEDINAITANIRAQYGARGDGLSDDTRAFERFFKDVRSRAVLRVPAGRYLITRPLRITPNVVIRGDGKERTFLVFECGGVGGGNTTAADFRDDHWLSFANHDTVASQEPLARVTETTATSSSSLRVDDVSKLKVGQWVRLVLDAPAGDGGSLGAALSGGLVLPSGGPNAPSPKEGMKAAVRFNTFLTAVEADGPAAAGGKRRGRVTLGRALPLPISTLSWNPRLHASWSSWHRVAGVEGVTLEFPPGRGALSSSSSSSPRCNGLAIAGMQHAFVRGVDVLDADAAVGVLDSAFVTVDDVRVAATRPRGAAAGVEGAAAADASSSSSSSSSSSPSSSLDGTSAVRVINSQDVLLSRLAVEGTYEQDVAVQGPASLGVVLSEASGADLAVSLAGAFATLLTSVDFGRGTRPWGTPGMVPLPGPAAGTVVWNARASAAPDGAVAAPPPDYAPLASVVGLPLRAPQSSAGGDPDAQRVGAEGRRAALGWYYEPGGSSSGGEDAALVPPRNLLEAQRALRSAKAAGGGFDPAALAVAEAAAAAPLSSPSSSFADDDERARRQPESGVAGAAVAPTTPLPTNTPTSDNGAPYWCEGPEGRPCGCAPGSDEQVRVSYAASLPNASPGLRLSPTCGACQSPVPPPLRGPGSANGPLGRPSRLYGCHGELWTPKGRLPDFSYAGFRAGDYTPGAALAFASKPTVRSLRDYYGAVGDGVADDTPAFKRAEADKTLQDAVLYLPPGKYVLKAPIAFRRPGLVIRGAGRDASTIYVPVSLTDVLGNKFQEGGKCCASDWSHKGAFLTLSSWDAMIEENVVAEIVRPARRGDTRLFISAATANSTALVPGRWVRLVMDGDNGALIADMNAGYYPPGPGQLKEQRVARHLSRVRAVDLSSPTDPFVELERPLVHNISSLSWKPRLHLYTPQRNGTESGVEDLTIEFKWESYPGHFLEKGYNAIFLDQTSNAWVRNVRVLNSDSAVYLWGCTFTSVSDVELGNTPRPRGTPGGKRNATTGRVVDGSDLDGHRGLWLEYGESNLIERFRVASRFLHDLSVSAYETGSVFSGGSGRDLNIDFHRASPYANLFTDLDHGAGSRQTDSGGSEERGGENHAAALNTLWNVRGRLRFFYEKERELGPMFNFIAYRTNDSFLEGWRGWYQERLRPRAYPANLHASMLLTRKARLSLP